jgi:histidinol dehydrogenase
MLELVDGRDRVTPVHIARPRALSEGASEDDVRAVVERVRLEGDAALVELSARRHGVKPTRDDLRVDPSAVAASPSVVRPEVVHALEVLAERVRAVCERQRPQGWIERRGDEFAGEIVRPLRRVGIHVPNEVAARPSSVIAGAVPASVAGVEGVAVVCPPGPRAEVPETVLAACAIAQVDEVYRVGGAPAIAALAYGTESVRPVDAIVASGAPEVGIAARLVRGWVGVTTDGGSGELLVIADDTADPAAVAADLVAQAERGGHGTLALVTWMPDVVEAVTTALEFEVVRHERPDAVENALIEGGRAVVVRDLQHALDTANAFAPARLELVVEGAADALDGVRNAGAVFVGPAAAASAGNYVAGIPDVLPAGGSARWSSGLSVRDFTKTIYVGGAEPSALARLGEHIDAVADAEGLAGHARAVQARLDRSGPR